MIECIITSSVLIVTVMVLRFLFQGKISRRLQYALWGLVLLRLLMPFSLYESPLSIMNWMGVRDSSDITYIVTDSSKLPARAPAAPGTDAIEADQAAAQAEYEQRMTETKVAVGTPLTVAAVFSIVWLLGSITAVLWVFGTNFVFYRRLKSTRQVHDAADCMLPVYVTESIASPCLFGLSPSVYLTPKAIESEESTRYVLTHELCHYRHGDHIWSILRGLCLAAYWWNPLVWAAAILSRADSELACDEAVIRQIGENNRLDYGRTLIDMIAVKAAPSGLICAATTMISGKRTIKERLDLIIKNPKTLVPVLIAVLLVVAAAVGCTFTGAKADLDAKIEAGLSDPDPLVRQAWSMIQQNIEETSRNISGDEGTRFTDAEITRLELTDSFGDIQEGAVIEVYELNYRMLPENPEKIVLAGGMEIKDGWLLEKGSMGSPYLVAKNIGGERTYIGTIHPEGEGQGVPDAVLELLSRLEAKEGTIDADKIEEIQMRMYYQGKVVAGVIVYPKDNVQGIGKIVDLLNAVSPRSEKSVHNFPADDRVIEVALTPVKTVYLYEKDGRYYAETPYESIGELTKEAYEHIRENFGPIRPFPEDMDKTVFLSAIQDMLERYRSGNPPENPMEYKFAEAPEGIPLPYVNSINDFRLTDGNIECLYVAVIPFGDNDESEIIMQLNLMTPGDENEWAVSGVFFGGPDGTPLSLADYIKTAVRMNYRHIGWQSYTMDKETIRFVADAIIGALPETLDQTASEIDNESITRDYWDQGSCIELVFDKGAKLHYTLLGGIAHSYPCDRMLVCFTKSENVLFLSRDGVYTHTLGPLDATTLAPVFKWLHGMEFVGYMGPDRAEILGQKITVHRNADLDRLPPGYDMTPIESAMSRSVAFYQAAYLRQYELIGMLATDALKTEIKKWGDNSSSRAADIMQLSNITDVTFPVSVTEPVFSEDDPGRLKVYLGLGGNTAAVIGLVEGPDGRFLVDSFEITAD